MTFRLSDLKKSVRKKGDGYQITPARLEGRAPEFQIRFILEQFEAHLGRPRKELDPETLLDFVGDARLGRGLIATLAQWYRVRARTFPEVLECRYPAGGWRGKMAAEGVTGPVELRAWLYAHANRFGDGYLDPEGEALFRQGRARALGLRPADLDGLAILDHPDEAVLVRLVPSPTSADVMAAYNARAHTTLLRSARHVEFRCDAPPSLVELAARTWAGALEVEWTVEGGALRLEGKADALGCWTRHGRRVERAVLELLALPHLRVREVRGTLHASDKSCGFAWKGETLALLGAGQGARFFEDLPEEIESVTAALRRERDRTAAAGWGIRRPAHVVGAEAGVFLPHLELRRGDSSLFLRVTTAPAGEEETAFLDAFHGKTHAALLSGTGAESQAVRVHFPREEPLTAPAEGLLPLLASRLDEEEAEGTALRRAA